MFSLKREYLSECYSINEYYKNKLINAIDMSKLYILGYSKLHLNLIKLYMGEFYKARLYFMQQIESVNSNESVETDKKDYANAS